MPFESAGFAETLQTFAGQRHDCLAGLEEIIAADARGEDEGPHGTSAMGNFIGRAWPPRVLSESLERIIDQHQTALFADGPTTQACWNVLFFSVYYHGHAIGTGSPVLAQLDDAKRQAGSEVDYRPVINLANIYGVAHGTLPASYIRSLDELQSWAPGLYIGLWFKASYPKYAKSLVLNFIREEKLAVDTFMHHFDQWQLYFAEFDVSEWLGQCVRSFANVSSPEEQKKLEQWLEKAAPFGRGRPSRYPAIEQDQPKLPVVQLRTSTDADSTSEELFSTVTKIASGAFPYQAGNFGKILPVERVQLQRNKGSDLVVTVPVQKVGSRSKFFP